MSLRTASPTDWPALLRPKDIAEILDCSPRSAQRKVQRGLCGPFIELDGRRFIRRETFLEALREREKRPERLRVRQRYRRRRRA